MHDTAWEAAMAQQEQFDKLWSMMKDAKFAMLVSRDGGHLRGRPMAASQDGFDGTLWFFTSASSHKVDEVGAENQVCVTNAEPSSQDYLSMSGPATLVRDQAEKDRRWSELLKTWFPKGKNDPDVALLKVTVEQAEYWDAPNSTVVHAYGYVKSVLTGEPPKPGDHAKVQIS